jgi:hypothetical protein
MFGGNLAIPLRQNRRGVVTADGKSANAFDRRAQSVTRRAFV